jgi:cation:H+ antiporter
MAVVWMILIVVGLGLAIFASRRAVTHASALAFGLRIPPFLIGITLVAIGTDLPEIANSIAASVSGNGDLNVGDSVGSAATQITLVLGIAPLAGGAFIAGSRGVAWVGALTAVALAIGAVLFSDGYLGRRDAAILLAFWLAANVIVWRVTPPGSDPVLTVPSRTKSRHLRATLAYLALVGVGATAAVVAFVEFSDILGVPQYLIAFFVASIGTSLPELVVSVSALRQGARDLAVGDLFGASLSDASLSIAAGPLIAPTAITGSLAVRGSIVALIAVALVTILVVRTRRVDWKVGVTLLTIYGGFYVALLV